MGTIFGIILKSPMSKTDCINCILQYIVFIIFYTVVSVSISVQSERMYVMSAILV